LPSGLIRAAFIRSREIERLTGTEQVVFQQAAKGDAGLEALLGAHVESLVAE